MHDLIRRLQEEVALERAVVITGAGVAAATAGPSSPAANWSTLIEDGLTRCLASGASEIWASKTKAKLALGTTSDLIAAAEDVATHLGWPEGALYRKWLQETVGGARAKNRELIKALDSLGILIATTNYDDLLEEITGRPTVTWRERTKVEQVLKGDLNAILHLHGHWEDPSSIVFGSSSYMQVVQDEHAQAVQHALRLSKTLIFVGFGAGLSDPNFGELLNWMERNFADSEYPQFRLARESELEAVQLQHSPRQRVHVLAYW